jgi:hypothetical protein
MFMDVSEECIPSIFRVEDMPGKQHELEVKRKLLSQHIFHPEDGGSIFPRNAGELLPDYIASHPRR